MASNASVQASTASAWPLPPAHYTKASTLQPPELPPFEQPKPKPSADVNPAPVPSFWDSIVYDVPLNFHYSQQIKSIAESVSIVVPNEHVESPKAALKSVNEALLVAFVRVINSLSTNPKEPADKYLDSLRQYLMIFHQLLNAYRPHQARQTAITLLEAQCERRKKFLEKLKERLEKSKQILAIARNNLASIDTKPPELTQNYQLPVSISKSSDAPGVDPMDVDKS